MDEPNWNLRKIAFICVCLLGIATCLENDTVSVLGDSGERYLTSPSETVDISDILALGELVPEESSTEEGSGDLETPDELTEEDVGEPVDQTYRQVT